MRYTSSPPYLSQKARIIMRSRGSGSNNQQQMLYRKRSERSLVILCEDVKYLHF